MICPKCGSNNITFTQATETIHNSNVKGFGFIKACIGYVIFSVPGILCGLCGMGKGKTKTTTITRTINICQNCGHRF